MRGSIRRPEPLADKWTNGQTDGWINGQDLLAPTGVFYMVVVVENKPAEIAALLATDGFSMTVSGWMGDSHWQSMAYELRRMRRLNCRFLSLSGRAVYESKERAPLRPQVHALELFVIRTNSQHPLTTKAHVCIQDDASHNCHTRPQRPSGQLLPSRAQQRVTTFSPRCSLARLLLLQCARSCILLRVGGSRPPPPSLSLILSSLTLTHPHVKCCTRRLQRALAPAGS